MNTGSQSINAGIKSSLLTALLVCSMSSHADSGLIRNPSNNHWYQRFDTPMTWKQANAACTSIGGYLATITSKDENTLVWNKFGVNPARLMGHIAFWLGGSDAVTEGKWEWVTGEPWNYTNWHWADGPDDAWSGQDYLIMWDNNNGTMDDGGLPTYDEMGSYLCEWEANPNQYVDVTAIPDISGDGLMDQATLTLTSGKYYLRVVDGVTSKQLKQVNLGAQANLKPISLTVADDTDHNGYKDLAILIANTNGTNVIQIRDSFTGTLLKNLVLP